MPWELEVDEMEKKKKSVEDCLRTSFVFVTG